MPRCWHTACAITTVRRWTMITGCQSSGISLNRCGRRHRTFHRSSGGTTWSAYFWHSTISAVAICLADAIAPGCTMTLVYLVAGEASGDALGARLMAALRARRADLAFAGIGGTQMAAHGLHSLFPMRDLALMGLLEVLPRLRQLRHRLQQTVADIEVRRPDVIVTIDSPGFSLRVLKAIRSFGVKRVHYVAPQVWAWRENRVRHYPGLWDPLLCLL